MVPLKEPLIKYRSALAFSKPAGEAHRRPCASASQGSVAKDVGSSLGPAGQGRSGAPVRIVVVPGNIVFIPGE